MNKAVSDAIEFMEAREEVPYEQVDALIAELEAAEAKIAAVEAALEKYEYDIPGHGDLIETRHIRAALDGTA